MKKCYYCEARYDGDRCPFCGASEESSAERPKQSKTAAEAYIKNPEMSMDLAQKNSDSGKENSENNNQPNKAPEYGFSECAQSKNIGNENISQSHPHEYQYVNNYNQPFSEGLHVQNQDEGQNQSIPQTGISPQFPQSPDYNDNSHYDRNTFNNQYGNQYGDMHSPSGVPPYMYGEYPAVQRKKYTAGGVILSLLKSAGFIGLYLAVTNAVFVILSFFANFFIVMSNPTIDSEALNREILTLITTPTAIFSSALTIFLITIFFVILKRNPAEEMSLRSARPVHFLYAAAMGISLQFVITFTISLIPPVAEFYSKAFENQYYAYMQAPLWMEILNIALFAPALEELLFRGMVYKFLRRAMPFPAAMIIASVAFGLLHGNIVSIIYATLLSIVMICMFEKTGSLFVTFVFHAALNGTSFIMEYLPDIPSVLLSIYAISIVVTSAASVLLIMSPGFDDRRNNIRNKEGNNLTHEAL